MLISKIINPVIFFIFPSESKLPKELTPNVKLNQDQSSFVWECQKLLTGQFSKKFQAKDNQGPPVFKWADCLGNFGVFSLPAEDNSYCHTAGEYNSNNWMVEKGTIAGIEAYRVHPSKSKPTNCLVSHHCVIFKLESK